MTLRSEYGTLFADEDANENRTHRCNMDCVSGRHVVGNLSIPFWCALQNCFLRVESGRLHCFATVHIGTCVAQRSNCGSRKSIWEPRPPFLSSAAVRHIMQCSLVESTVCTPRMCTTEHTRCLHTHAPLGLEYNPVCQSRRYTPADDECPIFVPVPLSRVPVTPAPSSGEIARHRA